MIPRVLVVAFGLVAVRVAVASALEVETAWQRLDVALLALVASGFVVVVAFGRVPRPHDGEADEDGEPVAARSGRRILRGLPFPFLWFVAIAWAVRRSEELDVYFRPPIEETAWLLPATLVAGGVVQIARWAAPSGVGVGAMLPWASGLIGAVGASIDHPPIWPRNLLVSWIELPEPCYGVVYATVGVLIGAVVDVAVLAVGCRRAVDDGCTSRP